MFQSPGIAWYPQDEAVSRAHRWETMCQNSEIAWHPQDADYSITGYTAA